MMKASIEAIIRALNESGARYMIAGGLAVIAHGYVRFTGDFDLMLALDDANVQKAMQALKSEGFRPKVPVPIEQFADAEARESWVRDKGMVVFSLWSDKHPSLLIDIFVEDALDFDRAYKQAFHNEIADELVATYVSLADLLRLKEAAGRDKDLIDISYLRRIEERLRNESPET